MTKNGFLILALLGCLSAGPATAQTAKATRSRGAAAQSYYLVLLKNSTARRLDLETLATIQAGHVAHLQQLTRQGRLTMAGRCPGANNEVGGMYILSAKNEEEARRLTAADPAVQAGSLTMEIYPWEKQDLRP